MNAKIITVIERLGATEMAAEIIVDIVARGLGKMGGRPKKPPPEAVLITGYEPVTNGLATGSEPVSKPAAPVSGDLPLLRSLSGSPDLSKQTKEIVKTNGAALAVAKPVGAYTVALVQFKAAFFARYGIEYAETSSDRNQLGKLVHDKTREQLAALPACFAAYMNDCDPFVAQVQRHSLTWFCTKGNGFNKYRTSVPVLSVKEARSVAAGEQWEAMADAES